MKKILLSLASVLLAACTATEPPKSFHPGQIWADTEGTHINAHGGGVIYHKGTYYWYGEHKCDTTSSAMVGVTCYSSKNLTDWTNEGVAMSVADDPQSDITRGCVLERPKVIYNQKTGKFVMWFHLELKGQGYLAARSGVAVSDSPTGPFQFIRSGRVNAGQRPVERPQDVDIQSSVEARIVDSVFERDLPGGQMARDMTLFVDDDGKAYHIYSSEENYTLHLAELSEDYLSHTGRFIRLAPGGHNEAPAIFKRNGTYWLITSGCTGWAPNKARMFSAPALAGPWTQHPNPCVGPDQDLTFGGQSTYILPVEGCNDAFIFMADIWRPQHPIDARYIWLPIQFSDNGTPRVEWMDSWDLTFFE